MRVYKHVMDRKINVQYFKINLSESPNDGKVKMYKCNSNKYMFQIMNLRKKMFRLKYFQ